MSPECTAVQAPVIGRSGRSLRSSPSRQCRALALDGSSNHIRGAARLRERYHPPGISVPGLFLCNYGSHGTAPRSSTGVTLRRWTPPRVSRCFGASGDGVDSSHGTKDVLAHVRGPGSWSRSRSATMVGTGRNSSHSDLELVGGLSQRLVLELPDPDIPRF